MSNNKREYLLKFFTLTKYSITVILIFLGFLYGNRISALLGGIELIAVIVVTNLLLKHRKFVILCNICNSILIFLINAQLTILRFGGTFLSMIMVTNIASISELRGKAFIYITFGAIAVVGSLLPVTSIDKIQLNRKYDKMCGILISAALIAVEIFTFMGGLEAPFSSLYKLGKDLYNRKKVYSEIRERMNSETSEESLMKFYKQEAGDYFEKPDTVSDTPNIILIFTEGLSQNIVEDDRNIMPNVKEYETRSLFFENYYNHTAATYRGIIGQLFSAYQFDNYDENGLISVQSILQENGYNTTFLNSEPNNADWTKYLNNLGFNSVINDGITDRHLTDKEMYELLYETLADSSNNIPQFIAMYTVYTHVSFDSADQKYGDGTDRVLNKFYDADYQFGNFMDKIMESEFADNTIIIFTSDHATYCDDDFKNTFYPDYERVSPFCDEIPLFIWYKGVSPYTVDVNGRNSLGLAPTILDFLDMDAQNFFLGNSLFQEDIESPQELLINTTYAPADGDASVRTDGDQIRSLTSEEASEFTEIFNEYVSCAMKAKE